MHKMLLFYDKDGPKNQALDFRKVFRTLLKHDEFE